MGVQGSETHFATTAHGLRPFPHRGSSVKLCELCAYRASHKVNRIQLISLACLERSVVLTFRSRLAHRIRDMQTLPYVVVTNPHISAVYELYYKAFDSLRRVREIKTLEDNENFCKKISQTLQEHLTVIPKLAMGVLECRDLMRPEDMDRFMNTILRSVSSIRPLDFGILY